MENIVLDLATLASACFAITEIAKRAFSVSEKHLPLVAVVAGVSLALGFVEVSRQAALTGLFAAFMASGFWSQGKTVLGK